MKTYSDLMDNDNLSDIQPGDLVIDYWGVHVLLNKQTVVDGYWNYRLFWLNKKEIITRLYRYSNE